MTLESILSTLGVVGVAGNVVQINHESVVTDRHSGIAIVIRRIPLQAIPSTPNDILCSLVNACPIVGEEVVCQKVVQVEITVDFGLELVGNPLSLRDIVPTLLCTIIRI